LIFGQFRARGYHLATTMADNSEVQKLAALLEKAKVDRAIIEFMIGTAPTGLEISSMSDFVDYVTHNLYQTELQTEVLDCLPREGEADHPLRNSRINLARLRTAWQEAAAHMEKRKKRRVDGAQDDLDEPIEDGIRTDLLTAFHARHQVSPTMFLMPSDHLLGRIHREFENNNMSVLPIKKAISLYLASQPKEPHQIALGGGVSVKVGNAEPPPVRKITRYYFGLRVLANAKAIAGTHLVPSKMEPGTKVVFAPLGVNQDYADHWLRRAAQWDLGESVVLEWAQQRDEDTRSKEIEMVRGGWSQGEALERALALTEVAWTIGPANKPAVPTDEQAEKNSGRGEDGEGARPTPSSNRNVSGKSGERRGTSHPSGGLVKTVSALPGGQVICKKFNDPRTCSTRERDCPEGRRHVCDVLKPNGDACGSKTHNRLGNCPFIAQQ
jgi:hypothetical protein